MGTDRQFFTRSLPLLGIAAVTAALLAWGWRAGLLAPDGGRTLFLLLAGGLLNLLLLATYLTVHERLTRRSREIGRARRELRVLLGMGSAEGVLRKQLLIRELNAAGAGALQLGQAALSEADLAGADLRGCNLRAANLRAANLQGARLAGADLFGADLREANLAMADLQAANLRSADLAAARLVKAQLAGADLQRANLVDANLEGTPLAHAHLHKARFARREPDALDQTPHPSVDDWIRARLDERGFFIGSPREERPDEPTGHGARTDAQQDTHGGPDAEDEPPTRRARA